MKTVSLPLPSQSLVRLLACVLVVLCAMVLLLYPGSRKELEIEDEIGRVSARIEEQRELLPLYQDLARQLAADVYGLPAPKQQALTQGELQDVISMVQAAAEDAGMKALVLEPDPASVTEGFDQLLLFGQFSGPFKQVPELYRNLVAVPYVRHIEEMRIETSPSGPMLRMKIWLAVRRA